MTAIEILKDFIGGIETCECDPGVDYCCQFCMVREALDEVKAAAEYKVWWDALKAAVVDMSADGGVVSVQFGEGLYFDSGDIPSSLEPLAKALIEAREKEAKS